MRTDPKPLNNPATHAGKIAYVLVALVLVSAFLTVFTLNDNPEAFSGSSYSQWSTHYIDADQYALLADALRWGLVRMPESMAEHLEAAAVRCHALGMADAEKAMRELGTMLE